MATMHDIEQGNFTIQKCVIEQRQNGGWTVELPPKHRGLATTTYSYALTSYEKQEAAERIAALWNLGCAMGVSTEEINNLADQYRKQR